MDWAEGEMKNHILQLGPFPLEAWSAGLTAPSPTSTIENARRHESNFRR